MTLSTTIPQLPVKAVRRQRCTLCLALPGKPCQPDPAGDHLARWLAAYKAGAISRDELTQVFSNLVVLTRFQLVTEAEAA